jgi:hypothetical protein
MMLHGPSTDVYKIAEHSKRWVGIPSIYYHPYVLAAVCPFFADIPNGMSWWRPWSRRVKPHGRGGRTRYTDFKAIEGLPHTALT